MRIILSLLLVSQTLACLAQDQDYPDFRSKKESFAHIYDKEIRSDLACFAIGGLDESMGKGQLKKIPISGYGDGYILFDSNNVRINIRSGTFDPAKHKLIYSEKHLLKIDGRAYYGNFGEVPKTTLAAVIVVIDKDTIPIPAAAFADLYNPAFTYSDGSGVVRTHDAVYLSPDKRRIYIYMLNKDNKGSYEVTWIIQDKQYLRRVLDYGLSN